MMHTSGIVWAPGATVAGAITAGVGFVVIVAQFGINEVAARRLTKERRKELYGPPKRNQRVAVMVAPTLQERGGGLALVGVW